MTRRPAISQRAFRHFVPIAVALLLPLAACAQPPAAGTPLVAGTDYAVIDNGQPWRPLKGQVEVVEIFSYSCSHCASFEPLLTAWKSKQPKDVRVTYVPAAYNLQEPFARATFAAQQLGALDKTHAALFRAVHTDGAMPMRNPSVDELATFYRGQGVDVAKFRAAFVGPLVDAEMNRAREFAVASGLEGTPTLVVNGRYRILGRSHEDTLRIASQLIAMERKAATAGAAR